MNITIDGREYVVNFEYDDCAGTPWDFCDAHGVVSEWTSRDKKPGERVLCEDRGVRRYYDVQQTVKIALRDGWGCAGLDGTETPRQRAAKAVDADFEYLRAWCNNEWHYVIVTVTAPDGSYESLGMIETYGDYHEDVAQEMAEAMHAQHVEETFRIMEAVA